MAAGALESQVAMRNNSLPLFAAALSLAGFVAWLSLSEPDPPPAAPAPPAPAAVPVSEDRGSTGGSVVPCVAPLAWRISDIDARFELDAGQARAVVERAAAAWERAAGRPLFVHDPAAGLPITFIFDARQATAFERRRLEASMAVVDERLRAERLALEGRARAYEVLRAGYEGRLGAYERWATAHADTVRGWNMTGGAPPALAPDIEAAAVALDRERMEVQREGSGLEETRRALQEDMDDLNRRVDERGERVAALGGAVPPRRIESALYRELIGREGDRVVALQRAIDVYRFENADELWLVIAHELGHAIGLGHAASSGAVMSEEVRRTDRSVTDVQREDLQLLAERCPALVVSGPRRP